MEMVSVGKSGFRFGVVVIEYIDCGEISVCFWGGGRGGGEICNNYEINCVFGYFLFCRDGYVDGLVE